MSYFINRCFVRVPALRPGILYQANHRQGVLSYLYPSLERLEAAVVKHHTVTIPRIGIEPCTMFLVVEALGTTTNMLVVYRVLIKDAVGYIALHEVSHESIEALT